MGKLWLQLTLAFSLVTLVGVAIVALLANRRVSADFRSYLAQSQVQDSPLATELSDYYATHGSWSGVEQLLGAVGGARRGQGALLGRGGPQITLADAEGLVVYSASAERAGDQLSQADRAAAMPMVVDGQAAGYLLVRAGAGSAMSQTGQQFLRQVNWALLQAGLLAGALGIVLGVVIARGLAAPLSQLSAAARLVAHGQLGERVPVGGAAEIADAARAFNEMADSLQQAERLRQNMIADIAHELRTPLTVIQGNLHALLDDVYPLEKTEIATIYDETLLLSRLVGDLRDLARAEAGQLALEPRPSEVASLVAGVLAPFEAAAAAQGVRLATELPPDLPQVQADPDRLRQVLHNLVANALRYTPAGGSISVSARCDDARAKIENGSPSKLAQPALPARIPSILVVVSDTGQGIAPEDLPHVFERFWRADRSRAREGGGSGLGLAIAQQLIQAQGGQIGVDSRPGQGSQFWFRLPAAGGTTSAGGEKRALAVQTSGILSRK